MCVFCSYRFLEQMHKGKYKIYNLYVLWNYARKFVSNDRLFVVAVQKCKIFCCCRMV